MFSVSTRNIINMAWDAHITIIPPTCDCHVGLLGYWEFRYRVIITLVHGNHSGSSCCSGINSIMPTNTCEEAWNFSLFKLVWIFHSLDNFLKRYLAPSWTHFHSFFQSCYYLLVLQLGVWFNAGYCAWKLEHYADAVTCYHRCVSLTFVSELSLKKALFCRLYDYWNLIFHLS